MKPKTKFSQKLSKSHAIAKKSLLPLKHKGGRDLEIEDLWAEARIKIFL